MSPGRDTERPHDEDALAEAPVEKFLRLAASETFLRVAGEDDEPVAAFVTVNVGGIMPTASEEPDETTSRADRDRHD
jgi:hypothetical protein